MKKILLIVFSIPFLIFGQGSQDFENTTLSTSYEDGEFTEDGITYYFFHSRDQDAFPIQGSGLMLRTPSDSYFEWTIPNGIGELTFQYRKAFTGGSPRQLQVLVNNDSITSTEEFGEGSGAQSDIYTFNYAINVEGSATIRIKNVGDVSSNRQSVIDNISWTGMEIEVECEAPSEIVVDDVTTNTAVISWDTDGGIEEWIVVYGPLNFDILDYQNNTSVEEVTVSTTSYTLEDLESNTSYHVYVASKCSEDNVSDWTGPTPISTQSSSLTTQTSDSFKFYPNPIDNKLNLSSKHAIENIEIFDLLGQKVMELAPNKLNVQINTESFKKGVYLLTVTIKGDKNVYRVIKK